jgi:hypothetical protein
VTGASTAMARTASAAYLSMPHWGGILSRRDVNALIAYLATLR